MSGTLDAFLEPQIVKPKQVPGLYIREKCSDCGKLLGSNDPEYALKIKGIVKPYCRDRARKRLTKPKETEEENKEEEINVKKEEAKP